MSEVNDITVFIYESISEIGEEDWEKCAKNTIGVR